MLSGDVKRTSTSLVTGSSGSSRLDFIESKHGLSGFLCFVSKIASLGASRSAWIPSLNL